MFSTAHTQSKPRSDGTKTKPGQQQQQKKKKKNPTTIQPPIPNHNTDDTSTNSKKKDRFLSTRVNSSPSPSPSKSARRLRTRERAHAVPFPVLYKTSIATQRVHRGVAGWITATPIDRSLARSEAFALRWPGPAAAAAFFPPPPAARPYQHRGDAKSTIQSHRRSVPVPPARVLSTRHAVFVRRKPHGVWCGVKKGVARGHESRGGIGR